MHQILLYILLIATLSSCDSSYQIDVYVQNKTADTIAVSYKKSDDGKVRFKIAPGEQRVIISSGNIPFDGENLPVAKDFCNNFTYPIECNIGNNLTSMINCCAEDVIFELTDVGQAEYIIPITSNLFE